MGRIAERPEEAAGLSSAGPAAARAVFPRDMDREAEKQWERVKEWERAEERSEDRSLQTTVPGHGGNRPNALLPGRPWP